MFTQAAILTEYHLENILNPYTTTHPQTVVPTLGCVAVTKQALQSMMLPITIKHCLQVVKKPVSDDDIICQCQWNFW